MPIIDLLTAEKRKKLEEQLYRKVKRTAEIGYEFLTAATSISASDQQQILSSTFHNALDEYTSTIYNIHLSLVSPVNFAVNSLVPHEQRLTQERAIVLASNVPIIPKYTHNDSEAGLEGNPTTLLIQDVNIEQHMAFGHRGSENPEEQVANLLGMNMQLIEPHGLAFDRVMRLAAKALGYPTGMSPAQFIWRVDIWFSGFNGLDYVEHIPMMNPLTRTRVEFAKIHSYYTRIVEMPVEVTMASSRYTAKMVPVSQSYFTLKDTEKQPGQLDSDKELTLSELLEAYRLKLDKNRTKETPKYHFIVPKELQNAKVPKTTGVESKSVSYHVASNILTTISTWLRLMPEVQKGLKQDFPRVLYNVEFIPDFTNRKYDETINDFVDIDVYVRIVPLRDYRFAPINNEEIKRVSKVHQEGIVRDRALRRVYTYMYGSDNTEVENMTINLNNAYYTNLSNEDYSYYRSRLSSVPAESYEYRVPVTLRNDLPGGVELFKTFQNLLGLSDMAPGERTSLVSPRGAYAYFTVKDSYNGAGALPTSEAPKKLGIQDEYAVYGAEFDRMVSIDLVELTDFVVRGDPSWMFSYSNNYEIVELKGDGHTAVHACPVIFIRIYRPTQADYMRDSATTRELDADLSGFYMITECTHSFSNGKFTNKLKGYRLLIT